MHVRPSSRLQSEINVTPLVDVCLVLLIIFMVVTPLMVTGVHVELPKVDHGDKLGEATRQLQIAVKDDGTVFMDGLALRHEQVRSELESLHAKGPGRPVAVRGDRRVLYGAVVDVLDACRAAGFESVGLVGEKQASK